MQMLVRLSQTYSKKVAHEIRSQNYWNYWWTNFDGDNNMNNTEKGIDSPS